MSDPGSTYRARDEISHIRQERDPLERVKKLLLAHGANPSIVAEEISLILASGDFFLQERAEIRMLLDTALRQQVLLGRSPARPANPSPWADAERFEYGYDGLATGRIDPQRQAFDWEDRVRSARCAGSTDPIYALQWLRWKASNWFIAEGTSVEIAASPYKDAALFRLQVTNGERDPARLHALSTFYQNALRSIEDGTQEGAVWVGEIDRSNLHADRVSHLENELPDSAAPESRCAYKLRGDIGSRDDRASANLNGRILVGPGAAVKHFKAHSVSQFQLQQIEEALDTAVAAFEDLMPDQRAKIAERLLVKWTKTDAGWRDQQNMAALDLTRRLAEGLAAVEQTPTDTITSRTTSHRRSLRA